MRAEELYDFTRFTGFSVAARRKRGPPRPSFEEHMQRYAPSSSTTDDAAVTHSSTEDQHSVSVVLEFLQMLLLRGYQIVPNPETQAILMRGDRPTSGVADASAAHEGNELSTELKWLYVTSKTELFMEYTRYCQPYTCLETQAQFFRTLRQIVPSLSYEARPVIIQRAGNPSSESVPSIRWPPFVVVEAEIEKYLATSHANKETTDNVAVSSSSSRSSSATNWRGCIIEPRRSKRANHGTSHGGDSSILEIDSAFSTSTGARSRILSPSLMKENAHNRLYQPRHPWQQPWQIPTSIQSSSESDTSESSSDDDDNDSDDDDDQDAVVGQCDKDVDEAKNRSSVSSKGKVPTLGDVLADFVRYYRASGARDPYSGPPLVVPPLTAIDDPFHALRWNFAKEFGNAKAPALRARSVGNDGAVLPLSPRITLEGGLPLGKQAAGKQSPTIQPESVEQQKVEYQQTSTVIQEKLHTGLSLLLNVGGTMRNACGSYSILSRINGDSASGGVRGRPRGRGSRGGRGAYVRARKEREAREAREAFLAQNAGIAQSSEFSTFGSKMSGGSGTAIGAGGSGVSSLGGMGATSLVMGGGIGRGSRGRGGSTRGSRGGRGRGPGTKKGNPVPLLAKLTSGPLYGMEKASVKAKGALATSTLSPSTSSSAPSSSAAPSVSSA